MNSYTYKFVWTDKANVRQAKYVDAPSLVDARKLFEEWFGFTPKEPLVTTFRL